MSMTSASKPATLRGGSASARPGTSMRTASPEAPRPEETHMYIGIGTAIIIVILLIILL